MRRHSIEARVSAHRWIEVADFATLDEALDFLASIVATLPIGHIRLSQGHRP